MGQPIKTTNSGYRPNYIVNCDFLFVSLVLCSWIKYEMKYEVKKLSEVEQLTWFFEEKSTMKEDMDRMYT